MNNNVQIQLDQAKTILQTSIGPMSPRELTCQILNITIDQMLSTTTTKTLKETEIMEQWKEWHYLHGKILSMLNKMSKEGQVSKVKKQTVYYTWYETQPCDVVLSKEIVEPETNSNLNLLN